MSYAAPEQLFTPSSAAARAETVDVYSLGQLAFYVITREDPVPDHQETNSATLRRRLNEWIDPRAASEILSLYQASTSRDPANRPATVSEFAISLARAETYTIASSEQETVPKEEFCRRLAHQYVGFDKFEATNGSVRFLSLSEQIEVIVRNKGESRNSYEKYDYEFEMSIVSGVSVGDLRSGAQGRQALNSRIDRALRRYERVVRHPGNQGTFQTFIEVKDVPCDLSGLLRMNEVLLAVLGALEHW